MKSRFLLAALAAAVIGLTGCTDAVHSQWADGVWYPDCDTLEEESYWAGTMAPDLETVLFFNKDGESIRVEVDTQKWTCMDGTPSDLIEVHYALYGGFDRSLRKYYVGRR
ncbi:hypothetical protein L0Y49_01550 [bacterium]|nr:hypothetical protein [bacterium]MCI0680247.1 hypothetical protein [bacterium]